MTDGHTTLLVQGVRNLLLPIEATVLVGPIRDGVPDTLVALTPYAVEDNKFGDVLTGIQVRIRGAASDGATALLNRQSAIFDLISTIDRLAIPGGPTIVMAWRQMSAPLGLDARGRPEIADSYYLRSDRLAQL